MSVVEQVNTSGASELRRQLLRFQVDDPEVSIVIPAYNEEPTLERLLKSMANQVTQYRVELIIVNNNSADRTQVLLDQYGVQSLFVREQGVAFARQAGLTKARGTYVANADADTVYPPTWLDALIKPLENADISCTYGTYSFIPSPTTSPFQLALYERFSRLAAVLRVHYREFTNVLGFNFAFRREDALAVGGYNLNVGYQGARLREDGRHEDGWMALCLMEKGRLYRVASSKARVCTSDRRLLLNGGPRRVFIRQLWREWHRFTSAKKIDKQH